jgi:non-ribosomal peptide synthetase component F
METVIEFLDELASKGVKLSTQAGQLSCYAGKGALTNDLRDGIIKFKPELIAFLAGVPAQTSESAVRQSREFPLSAGQKGLYILQQMHPRMSAYNVPLCFRINAQIDAGWMAAAWDRVLDQFPILTARVIERDGALYQRLDDNCRTPLQQQAVDFAGDEQLLSFLQTQAKQRFDLNRGPLTRAQLFIPGEQKPILLLTIHHIIFDGASAFMVLKSLLDFYQQLCEGQTVRLSPQVRGYHEFVAWEEAMLASAEGAAHARYWQQQLAGELPAFELVPDASRMQPASFEGQTLVDELPEDLCRWVRALSKAHALPPSVIFLALFQLLLHRYSTQDDIIVGMPVMGRAAQQFAAEVGYFINMVPLRARCGAPIKLIDFLRKVQGTMLDALYHSSYPFPLMVEAVRSGRSEQSPIFRVSYAYQNFADPADFLSLLQQQMFQLEFVAGVWQEGDFELGLEIYETPASSFVVHLKYDPELYSRDAIRRLFEHYCVLLKAVSADPARSVHEYPIFTEEETRQRLAQSRRKEQLAYWQSKLTGLPESPDLMTDHPRAGAQRLALKSHAFVLDAELKGQLKRLAERRGGTLVMSLLAAFHVLIHRYTEQGDLCVGTFGTTNNPLPLRSHVDGEDTFSALLSRMKAACLEAYENQDQPFEQVIEVVQPERDPAANPLFRAMVILQAEQGERDAVSKCDLALVFRESGAVLTGSVEYDSALYEPQTIERLAGHFTTLCRAIGAQPTARIRDLDYLGDAEKHRLLVEFNDTGTPYRSGRCIHQLFVEQASIHAERTAVVFGEQKLTYQELREKSRDVALYLQSEGVGPDSIVGICAERSLDTIVGILGILQAGGAYLPLNPADSDDRLAYILQDSQAAIVLADEKLKYRIGSFLARSAKFVVLGAEPRARSTELRQDVQPHHVCYVTYPSASAEKPAGVLVEHKALVNRIAGLQSRHPLNEHDAVTSDLSLLEIFRPIIAGGSLVLAAPEPLRTVVDGAHPVDCRLYGPAEAAGAVTAYECAHTDDRAAAIGTPLDNTQVYILDRHNRLQPIGAAGELHIAGDGLARGYLNRPKLTEEKFVANPFTPGTRMFKPGDRARWLDDGSIQLLGRVVLPRSN